MITKLNFKEMEYEVVFTIAHEGGYNVTVPALDGCFTEGDTEQEAMNNAKEVIQCYFEGLKKLNRIYSNKHSKSK